MTSEDGRYVSVDVEAAGPIPGDFSLLQIGACLVYNPINAFKVLIKPINENMSGWVREHQIGLFNQCKKEGLEPPQAMSRFEDWGVKAAKGRPIFVGFNSSFDFKWVDWYFHHYLGANPFGINSIDIKGVFMGKFNTEWGDTVKTVVNQRLNIHLPHTHDALSDAREQAAIFRALLEVK